MPLIGISTSFAATPAGTADGIMSALSAAGAEALELDYRLRPDVLRALIPALRSARIPVISVHNFCPIPADLSGSSGGGDLFCLSDRDADRRNEAVRWTLRTLETASEAEATAVVLHGGRVDAGHDEGAIRDRRPWDLPDTDEARHRITEIRDAIRRLKPPFLDGLFFSLDRLIPTAEQYGITLGLENRYHYDELPTVEDFGTLFRRFDGAPLGYWHDTGHAHAAQQMGGKTPDEMLEELADRLVGLHLHDARGVEDHLPPGVGEVDFKRLFGHLGGDELLVMELKPGTDPEVAASGLTLLKRWLVECRDRG
jgi:sugar phosphate isomerase/epimerase